MRLLPIICLVCWLVLMPLQVRCGHADIVVIVNAQNSLAALSRSQVIDIYMGRLSSFPDGGIALPFDLSPDSPVRKSYYQSLVGKSIAQVNAYWARLLFTGRASPPRPLSSASEVLEAVAKNKDAIGYVDEETVVAGKHNIKIVYRLEGRP